MQFITAFLWQNISFNSRKSLFRDNQASDYSFDSRISPPASHTGFANYFEPLYFTYTDEHKRWTPSQQIAGEALDPSTGELSGGDKAYFATWWCVPWLRKGEDVGKQDCHVATYNKYGKSVLTVKAATG